MTRTRFFLTTALAALPILLVGLAATSTPSAGIWATIFWLAAVGIWGSFLWRRSQEPINTLLDAFDMTSIHQVASRVRKLQDEAGQCRTERAEMSELIDDISTGLGEGLLVVDPDLHLRLCNPRAQHFLGAQSSGLGSSLLDLERNPDVVNGIRSAVGGQAGQRILVENPRGVWELRPFPLSQSPSEKSGWGHRGSRGGNEQFFENVEEIKGFRGGVLGTSRTARRAVTPGRGGPQRGQRGRYSAQGNPQIDEEISEKGRFRTGTSQGGAVVLITEVGPLRRAAELRRRFVQDLSHELRSPLAVMRTTVEALEDEIPPDITEMMVRQVERITRLTDELYELASIEAGTLKMETTHQSVEPIVRQVASDFAAVASRAKVDLQTDVAGDVSFDFDSRALTRVLSNLVDNAVKYNRPGGWVKITTTRLEAAAQIEVEDSGLGIPPSELGAVLQRFYRVDRARTPGAGGLGLGLAIVKHMVQLMGGDLKLDSREDVGTRVTVTFPLTSSSTQ